MAIQKQSYQIIGMRQDNLVSTGFSSKFANEIMNMRINTVGDYTTASWTTEEGTLLKPIEWVDVSSNILALLYNGEDVTVPTDPIIPIGQAVINNQWIIFATQTLYDELDEEYSGRIGYDYIFKLWYKENSDQLRGTILYAGNLNFDAKHPCETITFFENEDIQKVYWTDGKNQPRVINIKKVKYNTGLDTQFDFIQEVDLKEDVEITKKTNGAGLFPPCTVKYAITYYRKYGQETNIVYDSPLFYPIKGQRGCSPDELSGDSFEIKVTNIDINHHFDYIRLYSIIRTSENATPIVRIVADKEIDSLPTDSSGKYALFIDTNTTGEIVDPTVLQYIGGKEIVAQTIAQKNNTLFLGNIELKTKTIQNAIDNYNNTHPEDPVNMDDFNNSLIKAHFEYDEDKTICYSNNDSFYGYVNQMNQCSVATSTDRDASIYTSNGDSFKIKIFKWNENYRFGIQFQDTKGNWSEVISIVSSIKNNIKPIPVDGRPGVFKFAVFKYTLPNKIRTALYSEGFRKARIVCCYPNNTDRTILAQGILNPTIKRMEWNSGNGYFEYSDTDVMNSWFFRPIKNGDFISVDPWETNNRLNSFRYSDNIYTINSPEITFDESIRTLDLSNSSLSQVGIIPIKSYASTYYVEAGSPMRNLCGFQGDGFRKRIDVHSNLSNAYEIRTLDTNAGFWHDLAVYNWDHTTSDETNEPKFYSYRFYPFSKIGSLNDYIGDADIKVRTDAVNPQDFHVGESAKLTTKVYSNLAYSILPEYINPSNSTLDDLQIFDSLSNVYLKSKDFIYEGNVDTIAPMYFRKNDGTTEFYFVDRKSNSEWGAHYFFGRYRIDDVTVDDSYYGKIWESVPKNFEFNNHDKDYMKTRYIPVSSSPIPITFNSTAHAIVNLNNKFEFSGSSDELCLPMVEITKESTNRFGDLLDSVYIPCGPAISIEPNNDIDIKGVEGDHYFMRYDCLKTYPRSTEDINQIVEILSFMCETRINLDGRYDRNRGLTDNTTITDTNFNLINQSYTQSNNFFTFTSLNEDIDNLDKFSNLINWTKDKVSGEEVDAWTNITMASTADAEGVCGKISKIVNFNDNLYSFQEHGIAQIGYNEKTALSTEAGIPLEIANSGKFSGMNYLTKEVGCQNKWSISMSKNGVFFIDDSRQELLTLPELTSLSTVNGFDAFLIKQLTDSEHFKPWTPFNTTNFISYYDKLGNDIFYINKDYCLAWNEQSKSFTSFYSYNNIPLMANVGTHLLMWDINSPLQFTIKGYSQQSSRTQYIIRSSNSPIWAAREDESNYCKFFGDTKPYWMTIVCDGQTDKGSAFPADKVFNNIEYRADIYNLDGTNTNYSKPVFNKQQVWNGYQDSQECNLDGIRKFNTWRVQLPRNAGTRDRIRNPFCYIKLKQDQLSSIQTDRVILHDLAVYFDMK